MSLLSWLTRHAVKSCDGHHWHVASGVRSQGWDCCRCRGRIDAGKPVPVAIGRCVEPEVGFDQLLEWFPQLNVERKPYPDLVQERDSAEKRLTRVLNQRRVRRAEQRARLAKSRGAA